MPAAVEANQDIIVKYSQGNQVADYTTSSTASGKIALASPQFKEAEIYTVLVGDRSYELSASTLQLPKPTFSKNNKTTK